MTNTSNAAIGVDVSGRLGMSGVFTNSGNVRINSDGRVTAGGVDNQAGGSLVSNGIVTANLANAGTVNNNNNGVWTGTVSNSGAFNNNLGATVSGLVTNTAGTTTNNGALNGGANVQRRYLHGHRHGDQCNGLRRRLSDPATARREPP